MATLSGFKKGVPWVAGVLSLVALLLLVLMRTPAGHSVLEWSVKTLTGGEVVVTGLSGALPNSLQAERLELRDDDGTWLHADQVSLDWTALPALWNHIIVQKLTAGQVIVLRQPLARKDPSGTTPRIYIEAILLQRILLAPAVAGQQARLAARGSLHYESWHDLRADLAVVRSGSSDRYSVQGAIVDDVANGKVTVSEGGEGLLGGLLGLPGLALINMNAVASGSRDANALALVFTAGELSAQARGTLSLATRAARISFSARAPRMQLNPELGWASLTAQGRFEGNFDAPQMRGDVRIADLEASGYRASALIADVNGAGGQVNVNARLEALQIPGDAPAIFASAPVLAKLTADLSAPRRPLRFSIQHPLTRLEGTAHMRGRQDLRASWTIPSLAPFGAAAAADIAGSASMVVNAAMSGGKTTIVLAGSIKTQGSALPARLLGHATVNARAELSGSDFIMPQFTLDGAALASRISGEMRAGRMDFRGSVTMKDASRLTPALVGAGTLSGQVIGPVEKALVTASGRMDMAPRGFARERVNITLRAVGLPRPASGTLQARGRFAGSPLALSATLSGGNAMRITGDWKSADLRANLALPARGAITGRATVDVQSFGDLSLFTGVPGSGALHVAARLTAPRGKSAIDLTGRVTDVAVHGLTLGSLTVEGGVTALFAQPILSLRFDASKFAALGWAGDGSGKVQGPLAALELDVIARLSNPQAGPAILSAHAVLDMPGQAVGLRQMKADWRGESLTLAAPARVEFAEGLNIEDVKLSAGGGTISVSGAVTPKLALAVSAQDIRAETISLFLPQVSASGTLSATANLNGTLQSPQGTITLRGRNLRNRVYAVTSATAADLDADILLEGRTAAVKATLAAGKSTRLTLSGRAPLNRDDMLQLAMAGSVDLALLDPVLAPDGRRLRGVFQIDTVVAGTFAAPRLRGSATLSGGEFQDFTRGIRLHGMQANLRAQKDGIHLVTLSAQAGTGTISATGTFDAWSPGMPIDIAVSANNARPLASDLLTATLSGSARLSGKVRDEMLLKGTLNVPRSEVNLPQSFPPEVRTLNIRNRGPQHTAGGAFGGVLTLDLAVRTTGPMILRGRGIDADLGGNIHIGGTALSPRIDGGFEMRRGTLTLAGQTLDFNAGKITFDGTGVRGRMDPALDFTASQRSGGVTATLAVTGYASSPRISLSSSPSLPQDEIVARLLFQQSATRLSPWQLAEGAQALASMAGLGSGFSPLTSIRGGLGLDRFSVGSDSGSGNNTTIEAGKYVSRNIYVGARQGVSGGTRAQVQVDLTRNLKAQATISAGVDATVTQGAVAAQDRGSSIGLSYQFDY